MENGFLDEIVWPQKLQEEQHVVQFEECCQIQNGEIETKQNGTLEPGKAVQEPGWKSPLCGEFQSFESFGDSWLHLLWEKSEKSDQTCNIYICIYIYIFMHL